MPEYRAISYQLLTDIQGDYLAWRLLENSMCCWHGFGCGCRLVAGSNPGTRWHFYGFLKSFKHWRLVFKLWRLVFKSWRLVLHKIFLVGPLLFSFFASHRWSHLKSNLNILNSKSFWAKVCLNLKPFVLVPNLGFVSCNLKGPNSKRFRVNQPF